MGKVMTLITITNPTDADLAGTGRLDPAAVRRETIDALVDTGATTLCLPADLIARLGLRVEGTRAVRLADGSRLVVPRAMGVQVEILGRDTACDALVLPEGSTALIGQIPLEALDLVVDPKNRQVMPNPAHPDAPLLDLLAVA